LPAYTDKDEETDVTALQYVRSVIWQLLSLVVNLKTLLVTGTTWC